MTNLLSSNIFMGLTFPMELTDVLVINTVGLWHEPVARLKKEIS